MKSRASSPWAENQLYAPPAFLVSFMFIVWDGLDSYEMDHTDHYGSLLLIGTTNVSSIYGKLLDQKGKLDNTNTNAFEKIFKLNLLQKWDILPLD